MRRLVGFILLFYTGISGCSTSMKDALHSVRPGMDKATVLELLGNPKATLRRSNRDVWTYSFFEGEKPMMRSVVFENNQVVLVAPAETKKEGASSLDPVISDYEKLLNEPEDETKKMDRAKFKDIDRKSEP